MTPATVIRARGVSRSFAGRAALDHVDLEVNEGEVFGFLGPNGAGKSTLIRILLGLLPPSSGEIEVLGCSLPRQAEALRPMVGYMTQRFSLYEDLSVEENLDFAAAIFGYAGAERRARVERCLSEYDLAEVRRVRPAVLSGGWRQRLALGAATIHDPRLLVLDEPTAGVDPDRRRAFWESLFGLARQGTTILVSTHYMDEAVRCHRLGILRRGRMVGGGPPAALTAELDGRVVEISAPSPETAIAVLRGLAEVASATQLGHQVHVLLAPGAPSAEVMAPRLAALLAAHVTGPRARAAEATLEDVFVALALADRGPQVAAGNAP